MSNRLGRRDEAVQDDPLIFTGYAASGHRPERFRQLPGESGLVCSHDSGHRLYVGEQISLAFQSEWGQSDGEGGDSGDDKAFGEHGKSSFSFSVLAGVLSRSSDESQMAPNCVPEKAAPPNFF